MSSLNKAMMSGKDKVDKAADFERANTSKTARSESMVRLKKSPPLYRGLVEGNGEFRQEVLVEPNLVDAPDVFKDLEEWEIHTDAFDGRDAIHREIKAAYHEDPKAAKQMVESLHTEGDPRVIRAIAGAVIGLNMAVVIGYLSTFFN